MSQGRQLPRLRMTLDHAGRPVCGSPGCIQVIGAIVTIDAREVEHEIEGVGYFHHGAVANIGPGQHSRGVRIWRQPRDFALVDGVWQRHRAPRRRTPAFEAGPLSPDGAWSTGADPRPRPVLPAIVRCGRCGRLQAATVDGLGVDAYRGLYAPLVGDVDPG